MRVDIIFEILLVLPLCGAHRAFWNSPHTIESEIPSGLFARGISTSSKDKTGNTAPSGKQQTGSRHASPEKQTYQPGIAPLPSAPTRNLKSRRKPQPRIPPGPPVEQKSPPPSPSPRSSPRSSPASSPASRPAPSLSPEADERKTTAGWPRGKRRRPTETIDPPWRPMKQPTHDGKVNYGLRSSQAPIPQQPRQEIRPLVQGNRIPLQATLTASMLAEKPARGVNIRVQQERPGQQPIRAMPQRRFSRVQGEKGDPLMRPGRMLLYRGGADVLPYWPLDTWRKYQDASPTAAPNAGLRMPPTRPSLSRLPTTAGPRISRSPGVLLKPAQPNALRSGAAQPRVSQMIPTPGQRKFQAPLTTSNPWPSPPIQDLQAPPLLNTKPQTGGLGLMTKVFRSAALAQEHALAVEELRPLLAKLEANKQRDAIAQGQAIQQPPRSEKQRVAPTTLPSINAYRVLPGPPDRGPRIAQYIRDAVPAGPNAPAMRWSSPRPSGPNWKDSEGSYSTATLTGGLRTRPLPDFPNDSNAQAAQIRHKGPSSVRGQTHYLPRTDSRILPGNAETERAVTMNHDRSIDFSVRTRDGGEAATYVKGHHIKAVGEVKGQGGIVGIRQGDGSPKIIRGVGQRLEVNIQGKDLAAQHGTVKDRTKVKAGMRGDASVVIAASQKPFGAEFGWEGKWAQER